MSSRTGGPIFVEFTLFVRKFYDLSICAQITSQSSILDDTANEVIASKASLPWMELNTSEVNA